ncbi:hypothetical protein Misp06_04230 [Microbulbifer sp. NBRC 101763]|uniref:hypothetical protein n=1 Tax=Microbulbifer TaxID=48073 RepID=UPI00036B0D31|nr:hypothetical protein [Microbulbifer variabilis]
MKYLNKERLNLIIALSAIFISIASFYATYLQAKAANKQVRVMTMPVVKFDQGNFDGSTQKATIIFALHNAGAGPAILKNLEFTYQNKTYPDLDTFLDGCCAKEKKKLYEAISELKKEGDSILANQSGLNTVILEQAIIPAQASIKFLTLQRTVASDPLWEKLDMLRNHIEVEACFCSPLGDCYESKGVQISSEVKHCPHNKK